jgi:hypothetical protein
MPDDEAIAELAHRVCAICADAKREHELSWAEVYSGLANAMAMMMRSCDCPTCRKNVLNHVKRALLRELATAVEYSIEKVAGVIGHC